MVGFVAGGYGVGHVVVVVPELTRELDDFAAGVLGFELFAGAPAEMGLAWRPKAAILPLQPPQPLLCLHRHSRHARRAAHLH